MISTYTLHVHLVTDEILFWGHLSSAEVKNLSQSDQAKNQLLDFNWKKLRTCKKKKCVFIKVVDNQNILRKVRGVHFDFSQPKKCLWECVNNSLKPQALHFSTLHG